MTVYDDPQDGHPDRVFWWWAVRTLAILLTVFGLVGWYLAKSPPTFPPAGVSE